MRLFSHILLVMEYAVKIINLILNYYYYLSISKVRQKITTTESKKQAQLDYLIEYIMQQRTNFDCITVNSYIYLYTDIRIFKHFQYLSVRGKGAKKSYIESYQQENSFFGVPCFFSVIDVVLTRRKKCAKIRQCLLYFGFSCQI